MKKIIFLIAGLFLAAGAALLVQEDPGYMLLGYGKWSLETSLAIGLIALVLLFGLLYLLIRTVIYLLGTPSRLRGWGSNRRKVRSQKELVSGLIETAEGHWEKAEKYLIKHASESETPLLNYLTAARAAQFRKDYDKRDHYLQLANQCDPRADIAIGITQAELQIEHNQLEQALATLKHLKANAPRHTHILRLLSDVYQKLNEWHSLQKFIPTLKKFKVYRKDELLRLEQTVYRNLFLKQQANASSSELKQLWETLPKALKQDTDLLNLYFSRMIEAGAGQDIEQPLRAHLDKQWDDSLAALYGEIEVQNPAVQIENAEKWLATQPQNPILLKVLGSLCEKSQLWAKAEGYYEASIHSAPSLDALQKLGELYKQLGNDNKAAECFRHGLALATDAPYSKESTSATVEQETETKAAEAAA